MSFIFKRNICLKLYLLDTYQSLEKQKVTEMILLPEDREKSDAQVQTDGYLAPD